MPITNMTLEQAQESMQAKSAELNTLMKEAVRDDGTYDFAGVKSVKDIKNNSDLVKAIRDRNAELDELGEFIQGQREMKQAVRDQEVREKGLRGFPLPGAGDGNGGGGLPANIGQFKSLGKQLVEAKGFKEWHGGSRGPALDLSFDDMLGSDFLAKAAQFDTMGRKALMSTTAGFAPESIRLPGFVEAPTRPIQLLDILPMGRVTQAAVPFMEETTRTHAAAEVAEGGTFAESTFAFTQRSTPVVKIGDSLPVTDEQLEDVALIESYVNGRLAFGVRQRLDQQCMIGNGTAPNLRGILNTAGIQTAARGANPVMDAIYIAIINIMLTGRAQATHIVMHPRDFQRVRLTRTADGIYIYGSPLEAGPSRLWGLPVVLNDVLAEGTALIGAFEPTFITLFERRGIDIQVGYVANQFIQGVRTMRADMRAALAVFRPAAFHTVTDLDA